MCEQSRARYLRWTGRAIMGGVGLAAAGYAAYAGVAWLRYGHVAPPDPDAADPLLNRFMPTYAVVERHHLRIAAPASITLAAAKEQDLMGIPLVRGIFRVRELVLRSAPQTQQLPKELLSQVLSLGWGVLAELPGREIVVGSVTRPWEANVVFRALPPDGFAGFAEPGYVKIVWSLRTDPISADHCVFRTETRAIATDSASHARFRRYWAFASPGVALIRRLSLGPLRAEAERRAHVAAGSSASTLPTAATSRSIAAPTSSTASMVTSSQKVPTAP